MWIVCPIAGVGKRLQPFTYTKPKAFLKIAGKKIIDHLLIKLKNNFPQGTDILFIIGYKGRQISDYLRDNYSDYYNLFFTEQKPLGFDDDIPYFSGLADAVLLAKDYVKNDNFFIILSDRLPTRDYSTMLISFHQNQFDILINVQEVKQPEYYGVVQCDEGGNIKKIIEKPEQYVSNLAVSGAYLINNSVSSIFFELIQKQYEIPLDNGREHQLTPIIQKLIDMGKTVKINKMHDTILDFGRPESLIEGNRYLLSEIKQIDPLYESLKIKGNSISSKIIPPVIIGDNAKITNSIIGPNVSVGDNIVLNKCICSDTIIGDNTFLNKIITSSSLIGDFSTLEDLIKENIIIGDSSCISTSKR